MAKLKHRRNIREVLGRQIMIHELVHPDEELVVPYNVDVFITDSELRTTLASQLPGGTYRPEGVVPNKKYGVLDKLLRWICSASRSERLAQILDQSLVDRRLSLAGCVLVHKGPVPQHRYLPPERSRWFVIRIDPADLLAHNYFEARPATLATPPPGSSGAGASTDGAHYE